MMHQLNCDLSLFPIFFSFKTVKIINVILIVCHSIIFVTCHTIILDNRRPHERKSCSKDSCSKYAPSFHNHHWPSFFGRRKDTVEHQGTVHDIDGIDSTTSSSFSKKDIQDIETLNSELESIDGQRVDNHYSKGNDVSMIGKSRKRRGSNEYGKGMNGKLLSSFHQKQGDNRIRKRKKRSLKEESKLERRRMKCCQRFTKEKREGIQSRESDTEAEGNPLPSNPTEFHHRFGSLQPFPPYPHPPYPQHITPHPFLLPNPLIPNIALPFNQFPENHDQERLNSIHFNLLGPQADHEIYRIDPMINPFLGSNYYGNIPKLINLPPPYPPPTLPIPPVDQNKPGLDEDSEQGQGQSGERSDEMSVDEEEEEKRKIDFELERKRNIMLMSGQYHQYQPWIHGPIIPIF